MSNDWINLITELLEECKIVLIASVWHGSSQTKRTTNLQTLNPMKFSSSQLQKMSTLLARRTWQLKVSINRRSYLGVEMAAPIFILAIYSLCVVRSLPMLI